jgi:signal transduction histidine kinase/ActR/RegA family two-component response regulator
MAEGALALAVYAPPRDGELACRLLAKSDVVCVVCASEAELLEHVRHDDAGAILVAEEYLTAALARKLSADLAQQPAWSDLPILVVAQSEHHPGLIGALADLGNVSVLRRPMSPDEFVSSVESVLRARRRQLQVRGLVQELKEQSHRKDEFLAMLAHELRNPLAPVRYAAKILQSRDFAAGRLQELGELVDRQVGHMGRIIDDLLDTTRLLRGRIELHRERADLAAIARESVQSGAPLARARRVSLRLGAEGRVPVSADPTRTRQVVDNLIDNAIKFSPEGGAIDVRVSCRDGHAVLVVEDRGDGIDRNLLSHIFEPFVQATQEVDRRRGGLGLGLALVRSIVRLHGGEVTAESDGPGTGSRFTVHLPLEQEKAAPAQPPCDDAQSQALRIVVAEDNADSAETLRLLLELSGHEVCVAHTGLAAVDEARRMRPDALVCDIGLPGLTGYEVARILRRDPSLRNTRFIALTGYGSAEDRALALASGFDVHLAKPVDPRVLAAELAKSAADVPASGARRS